MLFDDLFQTSPKTMIMLGTTCFDLAKVQRFHYYDKKKKYCIYVKFEDGDDITINYDSANARNKAFTALRHAYCLLTDEEKAEREAAQKAELEKRKAEAANEPKRTLFGTVYPDSTITSRLDTKE